MRVLAIRGGNLASLKAPFEIDLTRPPLAGAGLFAIVGETGSGKSTILDALCLALYGKYPRVAAGRLDPVPDPGGGKPITERDPRALLRRGAAEGFAEVDFVGQDGHPYRARCDIRRARNKADGRLQELLPRLTRLDTGDSVAATNIKAVLEAVEARTDLTFEQFRRTVLLPQGEFDTFLLANDNDRGALLEKITGSEVYAAISRRVFEGHAERNRRFLALEEQCRTLAVPDDAQLAALAAEAAGLRMTATAWDGERARLNRLIEARRKLALARPEEDAARAAFETKRGAFVAAMGAAMAGMAAASQRAAARAGHEALADDAARIAALFQDRATGAKSLAEATHARAKAARDLDSLARRKDSAEAAIHREKAAAQQVLERISAARAALKALDLHALAARDETLRALQDALRGAQASCRAWSEAQTALAAAAAARRDAEQALAEATAQQAAAEATVTARHAARRGIAVLCDIADAAASAEANALRSCLSPGDPCPVCGAREHPTIADGTAHAALLRQARAERGALDAAIAEGQKASVAAQGARARAEARQSAAERDSRRARAALDPAAAAFQVAAAALRLHRDDAKLAANVPFALGEPAEAELQALAREAEAAREKVGSPLREGRRLANLLDGFETERTARMAAVEDAAQALKETEPERMQAALAEARLATAIALAEERLAETDRALAPYLAAAALTPEDVARDMAAAQRRLALLGREYGDLRRANASAADALRTLDPARDALPDAAAAPSPPTRVLHEPGGSQAKPHPFAALKASDLPGALRSLIDDCRARLADRDARERALALAAAHRGRCEADVAAALAADAPGQTDVETDVAAEARALALARDIRAAHERLGVIAATRAQAEELARQAARLRKDRDAARAEAAVWGEVNAAIGSREGDSFRRFAQGVTLDLLTRLANVELAALSAGAPRYLLARDARPGSLALHIRDRDLSEDLRGVRTLSGGERFLVSLALGLALAGLEGRRAFVDTLFIDEGFGALDAATLDMAIDALETLHGQGRKVGIVTHVADMIERIGVQVRVERRGQGESVVQTASLGAIGPG